MMETSYIKSNPSPTDQRPSWLQDPHDTNIVININSNDGGSTGKGILIGMLSAFGSAAFVVFVFAIFYFFRYTSRGRIFLGRIGRPGEYDDEQALARDEAEALEQMDDLQRAEYLRAKAFIQANPPETLPTDISLSQFLAIQEKGVSAWEFEPELEIANCFVEGRTEIEFFDSECSVQSNLPIPKQNEVYYWEAKIYDKPDPTLISIGVSTKPYPLFRLPGWHKSSLAYTSPGPRRHNQPFTPTPYGPPYVQGDVIGVGYRPRTGSIFFTRNGKRLDDVAHGLKTQNFFPTVGANGPCTVHVNFGQSGFVFIEANVKKWGLAPMTGSLAPPPPYGSEQGSILLEVGLEGSHRQQQGSNSAQQHQGVFLGHGRTSSRQIPAHAAAPTSPGPQRSPTEISLAQLAHIPSNDDVGEGTSRDAATSAPGFEEPGGVAGLGITTQQRPLEDLGAPPPQYTSPEGSRRGSGGEDEEEEEEGEAERRPLIGSDDEEGEEEVEEEGEESRGQAPIPTYDAAVAAAGGRRNRRGSGGSDSPLLDPPRRGDEGG